MSNQINATFSSGLIYELKKTFGDFLKAISGFFFIDGMKDCYNAFTKPQPNCPPDPGGGGGTSNPVPPVDPNDIYGYLSDAGCKFIADSVAKVNYTIEFENDTTFAKASAHTIVIRDTLDNQYFNLKAFKPTGVRLGGREVFLNETDVVTKNH